MFHKGQFLAGTVISPSKQRRNLADFKPRPGSRPRGKQSDTNESSREVLSTSISSSSAENEPIDLSSTSTSFDQEGRRIKRKKYKKNMKKPEIEERDPLEDLLKYFRLIYECSLCHFIAHRSSGYDLHAQMKHNSRSKAIPYYQCRDDDCELLCDTEVSAWDHLKNTHNIDLGPKPKTNIVGKVCELFDDRFRQEDSLSPSPKKNRSPPSLTKVNTEEKHSSPVKKAEIPKISAVQEAEPFDYSLKLSPAAPEEVNGTYTYKLEALITDTKTGEEESADDDSMSSNESPNLVIDLSPKAEEEPIETKEKPLPSILTFSEKLSAADYPQPRTSYISDEAADMACGRYKIAPHSSVALWWDRIGAAVVNHRRQLSQEGIVTDCNYGSKPTYQKPKKRPTKKAQAEDSSGPKPLKFILPKQVPTSTNTVTQPSMPIVEQNTGKSSGKTTKKAAPSTSSKNK
ncbi:DgyrCDS2648 [Dimorphilus gyrociliatus]|uniref:DgyrCDS2648 n=1 Tax=Dimorphilus gyrociliatus TaxID=2664684 RepID=A0A7I8VCQ2_9ANNE|nr:DgyrCDS2648 [Dimorphilus gyrociliatus]